MRLYPTRLAAFTQQAFETGRALKRFLNRKVYQSADLAEGREQSQAMIGELFGYFLEEPSRLPAAYVERIAVEPRHRVVCDYIAGMTDAFFRKTYEQMVG